MERSALVSACLLLYYCMYVKTTVTWRQNLFHVPRFHHLCDRILYVW